MRRSTRIFKKPLRLRGLRIEPPLLLAPMAGITHTAFRQLLVELGGVGLLSTEMLSARTLPSEDPLRSPYLVRAPTERPLSFQLLVASPEEVLSALDTVEPLGADAVDINMSCPAPQARRRGGGSRLMERPETARAIVCAARARTSLPLTVKIRLGERLEETPLRHFCEMLEGEGVDLVSVHARLRAEPFGRKPRWEWAGKVRTWVSILVVANGGIFSVEDARRCLAVSGCDGLMIGRGAAVRPWLFSEIARDLWGWDSGRQQTEAPPSWPALYRKFAALLEERFSPERRLGRLKELTHYVSRNYAFGHNLAMAVQASAAFDEALERAERFFAAHGLPSPIQAPGAP